MKILVTGFDPFGGDAINPAFQAVKLLPENIAGAEVAVAEIPTVFGKCGDVLRRLIKERRPDAVLCVGQAGGRSVISVEKVAVNLMEARIPDNEKMQPSDEPVVPGGPAAYFSGLPVKAMVRAVREQGIPAGISYTAGTFVCNDVMYRLLHMAATEFAGLRGGFVHVPFDTAQVVERPEGTPSMPIATIARALEFAVRAIVENTEDIKGHAGATH